MTTTEITEYDHIATTATGGGGIKRCSSCRSALVSTLRDEAYLFRSQYEDEELLSMPWEGEHRYSWSEAGNLIDVPHGTYFCCFLCSEDFDRGAREFEYDEYDECECCQV